MASVIFLFFAFMQILSIYRSFSLPMICNMPSAFLHFETVYLTAYRLDRSSFFQTYTTSLPLAMYQILDNRKSFTEKSRKKLTTLKIFWGKSSSLTSISSMHTQRVSKLVESIQNQLFITL